MLTKNMNAFVFMVSSGFFGDNFIKRFAISVRKRCKLREKSLWQKKRKQTKYMCLFQKVFCRYFFCKKLVTFKNGFLSSLTLRSFEIRCYKCKRLLTMNKRCPLLATDNNLQRYLENKLFPNILQRKMEL